jgi:hypothetical protein
LLRSQPDSPPAYSVRIRHAGPPGVPPLLPDAGISPTPDQRSGFTPAGRSCLESTSRSGLSLTRNGCPFLDHHYEVNAPGLPLRPPAEPISKPGLPPAPPPLPLVCRQPRAGSSPKTRGSDLASATPASPDLHSPLGFSSLRIKAFSPAHRQRIHLRPRPDLPSLPGTATINSSHSGSTLQVRYPFPGSLLRPAEHPGLLVPSFRLRLS